MSAADGRAATGHTVVAPSSDNTLTSIVASPVGSVHQSCTGTLSRNHASGAVSLPPASDSMRYSARVKTEATVRFGFYRLAKFVKKLFKRQATDHRCSS